MNLCAWVSVFKSIVRTKGASMAALPWCDLGQVTSAVSVSWGKIRIIIEPTSEACWGG